MSVAQRLHAERKYKEKEMLLSSFGKALNNMFLMLADVRALVYDENCYTRLHATKGTKVKVNFYPTKELPSSRRDAEEMEKQDQERLANMSEEERQEEEIRNFMAGGKYRPR